MNGIPLYSSTNYVDVKIKEADGSLVSHQMQRMINIYTLIIFTHIHVHAYTYVQEEVSR